MSGHGLDAPLAVQIARLNQSMAGRDKRRNQDRHQRLARAETGADPYDTRLQQRVPANDTGGVALAPVAAADAAVASAAALSGPKALRCDLCNATFRGEPAMQQHLDGPIHRKAVAHVEAERLRNERLGSQQGAAAAAVAAAAWANEDMRARTSANSMSRGAPAAGRAGGRGGGRGGRNQHGPPTGAHQQMRGQATEVKATTGPSHKDAIAAMRRATAPLSIGGWVPPSIGALEAGHPQPPTKKARTQTDDVDTPCDQETQQHPGIVLEREANADSPISAERSGEALGALAGYGQGSDSDDVSNDSSEDMGTLDNSDRVVSYF